MLTSCPECNHQVSDQAESCPHCGFPLNKQTVTKKRIRNAKPLKMPNGYGSVSHLPGKRRKPWRARKTDKWIIDPITGKAKQTYINIGTYETREAALIALAEFNKNPYDISTETITFEEVYQKWSDTYFLELSSASSIRTVKAAYNYCKPLYKMRMRDIRVSHLEGTILDADVGNSTKARMKSLFNMMYRYCMSNEIVDKDYASLMFCNGNPLRPVASEKEIIPFSPEEIIKLWDNIDRVAFVDMILVGIYSSWRPQELALLQIKDIDLDENTMKGGLKTEAGKNRLVPIHPKIRPLIENRVKEAREMQSQHLFNDQNGQKGTSMTYDKYRGRFVKVMKRLKMEHRPHEARHTFITLAKQYNMDEHIIKLIVGHADNDLTERVYTHRTIQQLQDEIRKIQ